jgi:type IV secretory pathway VirD2 relaxase
MPEVKSDTSVGGKSFKAKKTYEDDSIRRPRASKVFNRVQREKGSSGGRLLKKPRISHSHPVRPSPRGLALRSASRRCVVKVTYVKNKKAGQWAAHGKYLEREGAQKEGELGEGFNAVRDDVSLASEMHQWQMSGDPRLFKLVISPEDGDRLQQKEYTREFMSRLQSHVGKDLEWAAIDHYNTGHPHTHVVLRGKDNLQISPDLIRNGMRKIAEEIATERMGYKSELEIQKSREKEIEARQFTGIDKDIQARQMRNPADPERTYVTEEALSPQTAPKHADFVSQRLRIRRLETLERLGVAEKVGSMTWALDNGWDKALRDLQVLQRRTAMVSQGRALMTDPRCPPVVTKLQPGQILVGRVLGTGLDEQYDRSFLLIEGTDSRAHIVYQNAALEKERADQRLQPRTLVSIQGHSFRAKDGKTVNTTKVTDYELTIPDQHFKGVKMPEKALDDALDAGMPVREDAAAGFQAVWHRQLLDRQIERQRIEREKEKARKAALEREQAKREQEKARGKGKGKGIE